MNFLISLFFLFISNTNPNWNNNYKLAFDQAKKEHKLILLNFSGSDWCGPCIKMHKEVFTLEQFNELATEHMILVRADFPRAKKNQLTPAQQKMNDELADKYNRQGDFPLTVLIDADGKVIKAWTGFPSNIDDFLQDLKASISTN